MSTITSAKEYVDVVIIGGGPSGAVAAALLRKAGHSVLVLEREQFPRFSVGESLLPQSMAYLEQAGMLQTVVEAGFQYKNGAHFVHGDRASTFDFRDKHSTGWGTTYQVERSVFDDLLIRCAMAQGAVVRFGHAVRAMQPGERPTLEVSSETGDLYQLQCRFVLDASGFGRVLPRLLGLDAPTRMPTRAALFSHVRDQTLPGSMDRSKIVIAVHPTRRDVWFWMIPLAGERFSVGCVAEQSFFDIPEAERDARLRELIQQEPTLNRLIGAAPFLMPSRYLGGYAANVARLYGTGYALLGNAGEFLDPVFSSGVTIALRSSYLAVQALNRQLSAQTVDWQEEYEVPLRKGIDTFRAFVERWYTGELQDIIFYPHKSAQIRQMIAAVLAGYAWDESNPFVREAGRRLNALHQVCRE